MPETTIPVAERRYELLIDISLPNRYIRAGDIHTGKEWTEMGFADAYDTLDRNWFVDLTPSPERTHSEASKLYIFCRDILSDQGLRSMAYIKAAVRCVERDRANRASNPNP